ncbi:HTH-type transcriptional regulator AlsR [Nocardia seriolae]|uniref:HTH-type transcriptional regulator AlsR n=2 Tax=Nocardia seriolae TaxID=37332 RepID=A0ABC8B4X1_9NOCA|nr:LysR family transcriptional regulator [Nocardia seriolae]APB01640.1 HTH-type transcriptional regulator AlsR [Nocardia seriolae]BAW04195.1 transcriptional regulator [Nocardia seriolae]
MPDEQSMSRLESIDVTRLRWFVAVAEELHFARAARGLGISRQRLSATVIELEEELGTKLFVPGAQPTQLSEDGQQLLIEARELVAAAAAAEPEVRPDASERLRVGFVPGVTVTKWERVWGERFPDIALELTPVPMKDQESALREGTVDMCFVRLPIDREGLSAIPLYRELPVVVVPKDHPIAVFEQVATTDLTDERMQDASDLDDAAMTMELVAAVSGAAIVPHSIARLHHRKDLVYRTVTDAPETEIVLAWPIAATTELVEEFVGVVRGRSARSTRSPSGQQPDKKKPQPDKRKQAAAKKPAAKKPAAKKPAAKSRQGGAKNPGTRRGR